MELEQSNVALARKIYANAIIRNQTGVISALEVTQLQSQLLTAEGNYIMTIMEMLKIKVQLDNLYNK
jgi:outer membrane protein TolC